MSVALNLAKPAVVFDPNKDKVVESQDFINALNTIKFPVSTVILGNDQTMRVNNALVVPKGHQYSNQTHVQVNQHRYVVVSMSSTDFTKVFNTYSFAQKNADKLPQWQSDYQTAKKGFEAAKANGAQANADIAQANANITQANATLAANALKRKELLEKLALLQKQSKGAASAAVH